MLKEKATFKTREPLRQAVHTLSELPNDVVSKAALYIEKLKNDFQKKQIKEWESKLSKKDTQKLKSLRDAIRKGDADIKAGRIISEISVEDIKAKAKKRYPDNYK